jgi:protoporphyrinogen/coproporphyrinogen III oxidase
MTKNAQIIIVGSGVTGLCVAWNLLNDPTLDEGSSVLILDAGSQVGGCLMNTQKNGYLLEWAAQGVLASRPLFCALVRQLKLEQSALSSSALARKRFLISETNQLVPISIWPLAWIRSGLLNFGQYLRIFREPWVPKSSQISKETLYSFFERRFGPAAAKSISIPMASGIWAGGAREILLRWAFPVLAQWEAKHGSILKAVVITIFKKAVSGIFRKIRGGDIKATQLKNLVTFPSGMQELCDGLFAQCQAQAKKRNIKFNLQLNSPVDQIELSENSKIEDPLNSSSARYLIKTQIQNHQATHLAWCASPVVSHGVHWKINADFDGAWQSFYEQVQARSVVVVGVGGRVPLNFPMQNGFGSLAPESSKDLLGILNVHDINPNHAPASNQEQRSVLFRIMLGGDRAPNLHQESKAKLLEIAMARLLGLGMIPSNFVADFSECVPWQNAIVVQNEIWEQQRNKLLAAAKALPHFALAGNYLEGVGVEDCIRSANAAFKALRPNC